MPFQRVRYIECREHGVYEFYLALGQIFRIPPPQALLSKARVEQDARRRKKVTAPEVTYEYDRVAAIRTFHSHRMIVLEWGSRPQYKRPVSEVEPLPLFSEATGVVEPPARAVSHTAVRVQAITIDFGEHGSIRAAGELIGRLARAAAPSLLRVALLNGQEHLFVASTWEAIAPQFPHLAVHERLMTSFHSKRWRARNPQFAELWKE